ncbi:ABC transporter permease [Caballeronia sp. LZ029]|uniref:ABC transporter permease n=1 Tax=Caballeronia sp. LZ029 TaxID=3038564 RepID=UPI0028596675|nr:ABC transporter permease [Caballeronia sp. LZ029]MDR5744633.1 ABC transporter permease [Caballeronia sp. LZ029]
MKGDTVDVTTIEPASARSAARARLRKRTWLGRALRKLRGLTLLFVLIAAWQSSSTQLLDDTTRNLLPAPSAVLAAAWQLIESGDLIHNLIDSVRRELVAFVWACAAIPLGIAMSWWPLVEEQVDPIVEILRPVPPLAWIPLSILWFGIGNAQNEFIIFLGIFFPILLNTITGVKGIEPNLIRAARCLGASEASILTSVVFRAALPQILTGVRIGLGVGWMALVAAELVGAISGLGFMINDARSVLRTDSIIVGMATIGLVGLAMDGALRLLMRRLLPWSRAAGH